MDSLFQDLSVLCLSSVNSRCQLGYFQDYLFRVNKANALETDI